MNFGNFTRALALSVVLTIFAASAATAAIIVPSEGTWAIYRSESFAPSTGVIVATNKGWTFQQPIDENTWYPVYFVDDYGNACTGSDCTTSSYGLTAHLYTYAMGATKPYAQTETYVSYIVIRNGSRAFNTCSEQYVPWSNCAKNYEFSVTPIGGSPYELVKSGAIPEPATWAMMISGFGLSGASLRRSRAQRQGRLQPQQAS